MITPDRTTFCERAERGNLIPVVRELVADQETPVSAYEKIRMVHKQAGGPLNTFLLESVEGGAHLARYSFIGVQASRVFSASGRTVRWMVPGGEEEVFEDVDPLTTLRERMSKFTYVAHPDLPIFSGGAVGYIGYDAVAQFDRVPLCDKPGLDWPDILFGVTDTLLIFDHMRHTMKVVHNAFADGDPGRAYDEACDRIDSVLSALSTPVPYGFLDVHHEAADLPWTSNTRKEDFLSSVDRAKEYIRAGDIIQVVLSQRFEVEGADDPVDVYRAIRAINPSPYMFCLEFGERCIVGASPEIHVRCEGGRVEVRPIAGTRPRSRDREEDGRLAEELLADPKERAEHIMLVDLGRNDIGRVCRYGSVQTPELMVIERYSHVMHIVSDVIGTLDPGCDVYDLMKATFPAGTVSGAPKIRAMEIIAELEQARRGPYAGAIGYFSFHGNLDSCINIRTVCMDGNRSYVQAGAGIVADSDPHAEYEETRNKARGMLKALSQARAYPSARENAP